MTDATGKPAPKPVKLGLVWGTHQYEVKTITNSTAYKPGQWLNEDVVKKINEDPNFAHWDVSIADDQTFMAILGFAVSHVAVPTI